MRRRDHGRRRHAFSAWRIDGNLKEEAARGLDARRAEQRSRGQVDESVAARVQLANKLANARVRRARVNEHRRLTRNIVERDRAIHVEYDGRH